jgi:hypothetical protein
MDERTTEDGSVLKESLTELAGEVATLLRQEADVARCELAVAAEEARSGATKFGVGICCVLIGALALGAAAICGLTLLLEQWLTPLQAATVSSLTIAAVLGITGYLLIRRGGESIKPAKFVPRRAIETMKENFRWAQEKN